ncbi:C40 family peptidase [Mariniblastus fucicola]|nr:hypothetical protein [Mariniblastus fucicola]
MKQIIITEHELSGARLTIPFTALGKLGPKHHAIVVGVHRVTGQLLVAELSRKFGHRVVPMEQWFTDNSKYLALLTVAPNAGTRSNAEVAQSAIAEVAEKLADDGKPGYDLIFNNCETFAERHSQGELVKAKLSPQVRKVLRTAGVVIATGAVILGKRIR